MKSQLFHAGLTQTETTEILAYGFPIGSLPIRYLGLPLMSRKLRISEYDSLLAAITARFKAWSVKNLSFSGRVQLIVSVIAGTVNFWISTFLLPKSCIRKIKSLCARFLWTGDVTPPNRSRHRSNHRPTIKQEHDRRVDCLPRIGSAT